MDYARYLYRMLTASTTVQVAPEPVPTAASYRMSPDDIDHTKCVGRKLLKEDRRWTHIVRYESQCGKNVSDGGLCKTCAKMRDKYEGNEDRPGSGHSWRGRVTEEPLAWTHMLGTVWAETENPVFVT